MKIKLITIAKEDDKNVNALFQMYAKRIVHYTSFEYVNIKPDKATSATEQKKKDAALLLKKINEGDAVILLDEKGKELNSVQLSEFIVSKMNAATKSLVFVIGGAYGFDNSSYERSNTMISLSKLTLPHQLAKVLLAEQLYRAFTIIRNEKYHHGDT
ncbi:MAG: 23S rRNA (pseudouridine(1915)-N(3))-methyltransferase RlmH [Chitinophagales bacterium]